MENFESLLNDILENPELILQKDLTEEQLFELQRQISPYKNFSSEGLDDPNFKKILVFSYTNLKEEYLKKFLMTSLIGFIFQMQNELEIDSSLLKFTNASYIKKINQIRQLLKDEVASDEAASDDVASDEVASDEVASDEVSSNDDALLDNVASASSDEALLDNISTSPLEEKNTPALKLLDELSTISFSEDSGKAIISDFLLNLFKFDPNKHVRCATIDESKIDEEVATICGNDIILDAKDPSRVPLRTLLSNPDVSAFEHKELFMRIIETPSTYNAFKVLLEDNFSVSEINTILENKNAFKALLSPLPANNSVLPATEILPSRDVFFRWSYYNEVNFEELRSVTSSLYLDKPDLDMLFAAWDTIEGSPEKVDEEFNKYCQKHQTEFPAEIKNTDFGGWTFIGDFKQNREKINFCNRNTEVLKRILDRHESDRQLGAELMKNRIRQKKAKNIAEDGPDAPGLAQYKSVHGISLPGAEKVISHEEMLRLEKAKGNIKAAKELEFLENLEFQIQGYKNIEKTRELTKEEQTELSSLYERLQTAHEMAEVPDDAIQVDVFTNDTKSGTFTKSSFYTKSEELVNSHSTENK
jgi:hypothetical protein